MKHETYQDRPNQVNPPRVLEIISCQCLWKVRRRSSSVDVIRYDSIVGESLPGQYREDIIAGSSTYRIASNDHTLSGLLSLRL